MESKSAAKSREAAKARADAVTGEHQTGRLLAILKLANALLADTRASDLEKQVAAVVVKACAVPEESIPGDRKLPPPGWTDQSGGTP